jgi:hypothetical protein
VNVMQKYFFWLGCVAFYVRSFLYLDSVWFACIYLNANWIRIIFNRRLELS